MVREELGEGESVCFRLLDNIMNTGGNQSHEKSTAGIAVGCH